MIRMLKSAKDSTMKGCTQAINQMKGMVVTAPVELRAVPERSHFKSTGSALRGMA